MGSILNLQNQVIEAIDRALPLDVKKKYERNIWVMQNIIEGRRIRALNDDEIERAILDSTVEYLQTNYYKIIHAMQAKMNQDQAPFV